MTSNRDIRIFGPAGTVVKLKRQMYRLLDSVPHVTKRGETVELAIWETNCPECGARFEAKASLGFLPEIRRCPEHRSPGRRVKEEDFEKIADNPHELALTKFRL